MKTPKVKKKHALRKKSLNFKAQLVTTQLFYGSKNSALAKSTSDKISSKKPKLKSRKKRESKIDKSTDSNRASWFCAACGEDKVLSMRQCSFCIVWYHEECVGLDSDDENNFLCVQCC